MKKNKKNRKKKLERLKRIREKLSTGDINKINEKIEDVNKKKIEKILKTYKKNLDKYDIDLRGAVEGSPSSVLNSGIKAAIFLHKGGKTYQTKRDEIVTEIKNILNTIFNPKNVKEMSEDELKILKNTMKEIHKNDDLFSRLSEERQKMILALLKDGKSFEFVSDLDKNTFFEKLNEIKKINSSALADGVTISTKNPGSLQSYLEELTKLYGASTKSKKYDVDVKKEIGDTKDIIKNFYKNGGGWNGYNNERIRVEVSESIQTMAEIYDGLDTDVKKIILKLSPPKKKGSKSSTGKKKTNDLNSAKIMELINNSIENDSSVKIAPSQFHGIIKYLETRSDEIVESLNLSNKSGVTIISDEYEALNKYVEGYVDKKSENVFTQTVDDKFYFEVLEHIKTNKKIKRVINSENYEKIKSKLKANTEKVEKSKKEAAEKEREEKRKAAEKEREEKREAAENERKEEKEAAEKEKYEKSIGRSKKIKQEVSSLSGGKSIDKSKKIKTGGSLLSKKKPSGTEIKNVGPLSHIGIVTYLSVILEEIDILTQNNDFEKSKEYLNRFNDDFGEFSKKEGPFFNIMTEESFKRALSIIESRSKIKDSLSSENFKTLMKNVPSKSKTGKKSKKNALDVKEILEGIEKLSKLDKKASLQSDINTFSYFSKYADQIISLLDIDNMVKEQSALNDKIKKFFAKEESDMFWKVTRVADMEEIFKKIDKESNLRSILNEENLKTLEDEIKKYQLIKKNEDAKIAYEFKVKNFTEDDIFGTTLKNIWEAKRNVNLKPYKSIDGGKTGSFMNMLFSFLTEKEAAGKYKHSNVTKIIETMEKKIKVFVSNILNGDSKLWPETNKEKRYETLLTIKTDFSSLNKKFKWEEEINTAKKVHEEYEKKKEEKKKVNKKKEKIYTYEEIKTKLTSLEGSGAKTLDKSKFSIFEYFKAFAELILKKFNENDSDFSGKKIEFNQEVSTLLGGKKIAKSVVTTVNPNDIESTISQMKKEDNVMAVLDDANKKIIVSRTNEAEEKKRKQKLEQDFQFKSKKLTKSDIFKKTLNIIKEAERLNNIDPYVKIDMKKSGSFPSYFSEFWSEYNASEKYKTRNVEKIRIQMKKEFDDRIDKIMKKEKILWKSTQKSEKIDIYKFIRDSTHTTSEIKTAMETLIKEIDGSESSEGDLTSETILSKLKEYNTLKVKQIDGGKYTIINYLKKEIENIENVVSKSGEYSTKKKKFDTLVDHLLIDTYTGKDEVTKVLTESVGFIDKEKFIRKIKKDDKIMKIISLENSNKIDELILNYDVQKNIKKRTAELKTMDNIKIKKELFPRTEKNLSEIRKHKNKVPYKALEFGRSGSFSSFIVDIIDELNTSKVHNNIENVKNVRNEFTQKLTDEVGKVVAQNNNTWVETTTTKRIESFQVIKDEYGAAKMTLPNKFDDIYKKIKEKGNEKEKEKEKKTKSSSTTKKEKNPFEKTENAEKINTQFLSSGSSAIAGIGSFQTYVKDTIAEYQKNVNSVEHGQKAKERFDNMVGLVVKIVNLYMKKGRINEIVWNGLNNKKIMRKFLEYMLKEDEFFPLVTHNELRDSMEIIKNELTPKDVLIDIYGIETGTFKHKDAINFTF